MRTIGKTTIAAVALGFVIALAACSDSSTSSEYTGTWKTKDTSGADFNITLTADGKATGDRHGEGLAGTWKEEGGSAVIKWDSGWTTKITQVGDVYKKTAYEKDAEAAPSNTSDAVKVK